MGSPLICRPIAGLAALWLSIVPTAALTAPLLSEADGRAIAAALLAGQDDGLSSSDVTGDVAQLAGGDALAARAASARLSAAAVSFAAAAHGAIADPHDIDPLFALRAPYDAQADFNSALGDGRLPAWAAGLARRDQSFRSLLKARQRYAAIAEKGGWPMLDQGPSLALGATGPTVATLRVRLSAEGFTSSPEHGPQQFDAGLASALGAFQSAHGLPADGVLTPQTRAALNVPVAVRIATIDLNLERARWLPNPLPENRIEVDIANATAVVYEGQSQVLQMRTIVGDRRHKTPSLASKITAIVFDPPWIVPESIASAELYPRERRSPGYLKRNGFHEIDGRLIQAPSDKSALGYLKFDMASPFGVYLHDTPTRDLFQKDSRWLSHGCIRVQQPRALADLLLSPAGWTKEAIEAAVAAKRTRRVQLPVAFPVLIVYRTAAAHSDGVVEFRPDIYGWDKILDAALERSTKTRRVTRATPTDGL